jgi:NAD(P)-dependent dehydrogenase (short-subunit alcohol dehydrogenase family)
MTTIAYNTSKGAVINFTPALAAEWGKYGITVNALAPGFFSEHDVQGLAGQLGRRDRGEPRTILNGIEEVITRPDLADRAILLMLAILEGFSERLVLLMGVVQTMLTVVTQNSRLPTQERAFRQLDGVWFRLPALVRARRALPGFTRLSCKIGYLN